MGDERDRWLIEEDRLQCFAEGSKPLSRGELVRELGSLDGDEVWRVVDDVFSRPGARLRDVVALRAALDKIGKPGVTVRRAELVALIDQVSVDERDGPVSKFFARALCVVSALREIDRSLEARDKREILAAWDEARSHNNGPMRTAARLSLQLNMFDDANSYLGDSTYADAPEHKLQAAINALADVFASAYQTHERR